MKYSSGLTDKTLENLLGNLLRAGVTTSAAVVLIGAVVYLFRHGAQPFAYEVFRGESSALRNIPGIVKEARAIRGRGIIQLGLLVLIATPVARVAFSLVGFAVERDYTYVVITLIVLVALISSILSGCT